MLLKVKIFVAGWICFVVCFIMAGPVAFASSVTPATQLERLGEVAQRGKALKEMLGENTRRLSTGGQMLVSLGENWPKLKPRLEAAIRRWEVIKDQAAPVEKQVPKPEAQAQGGGNSPAAAKAKDGSAPDDFDDNISNFFGFTQSEVSIGWWNTNAVLGFNDSGSLVRTIFFPVPSANFSFIGWSRSTNADKSSPDFTDMGALVAPTPPGVTFRDVFGDPVVRTTWSNVFYYATLGEDAVPGPNLTNIIVLKSTDGGASFPTATAAASYSVNDNFVEKPWMDAMPGGSTATDWIYVTYTRFQQVPGDFLTHIEGVVSTDGGATWSSPVTLATASDDDDEFVQGSQVVCQPNTNNVYASWERYNSATRARKIQIRRSIDGGLTWGPTDDVTELLGVGNQEPLDALQGGFRAGLHHSLAFDALTGELCLAYHTGSGEESSDPAGVDGSYHYADVFVRGAPTNSWPLVWSAPIRVNNDTDGSQLVDNWQPGIAVDHQGKKFVGFYDRRIDPRNFLIQFFGATSKDGTQWKNKVLSNKKQGFAPVPGQDFIVTDLYMGDYNNPAADSSGVNRGFIVGWGDNSLGDPNIRVQKVK